MKRLLYFLVLLIASHGCIPQTPVDSSPMANFEALWRILDQKYCYFEQKGVDWDEVYKRYRAEIESGKYTDDVSLFNLLSKMIGELHDGHVNLYSSFNIGRYEDPTDDDTRGLNIYARRKYLGPSPLISGGMHYTVLNLNGKHLVGYIVYSSFLKPLGDMEFILNLFKDCEALILDVRGNVGGQVNYSDELVSYFIDEKELVGYTSYKIGKGHRDFSSLKAHYITPRDGRRWTDKPLYILQDRGCYSACNDFLSKVRVAKNVVTIGLPSSGGGGMPASAELPNGWKVRYSAVKSFDREQKDIESGIPPTYLQSLPSYENDPGADDLILKRALYLISQQKDKKP